MAEFVYCGTSPPVGDSDTQGLLRTHRAIWCPPLRQPLELPHQDDRIWLLWHEGNAAPHRLLGGGRIEVSQSGNVFWTDPDMPGVRDAARNLGYGGPTNMRFLVVSEQSRCLTEGPPFPAIAAGALEDIRAGLYLLPAPVVEVLKQRLPIK